MFLHLTGRRLIDWVVTLRVVEGHARHHQHTWRGTTFSTIVTPVLFLSAMGLGLGSLVDAGRAEALGGVEYLSWLAPGLLAGAAMQNGAGDGSVPVIAGIEWLGTYDAALNTPVRPADLALGNLTWATMRATVAALVYVVVATAIGATQLGSRAARRRPRRADCGGVLRGHQRRDGPGEVRSGPGSPPTILRPALAGVELARALALGRSPAGPWALHAAVVVGFLVVGTALSTASFRRRLHR